MGPTLIEEAYEKGLIAGLKKSEKQGQKNYLVQVAKRMLARDYPVGEISEITGLSTDEILKI
ncbi:MAG: hypothetical protein Q4P18_08330 [Methanobrevibacter sp.]|uniref:hypothetical protein n=1 Tax=Methanobrevibacter sp. TaxID=66852 RepID=UPI0026DEDA5C|nr:hypothetical protein [Methanobrevibacter sp.]MDO5849529.1 hypothetical protein [Methanobrevibacter sp.]